MLSAFFCLVVLAKSFALSDGAWLSESSPREAFDFDCPIGEAVDGITMLSTKASSEAISKGAENDSKLWNDGVFRIFCLPFLNKDSTNSIANAPPPRLVVSVSRSAEEFALSKGVNVTDASKNCAGDEYICGLAGAYQNNQRNLKYKCCSSSNFKRGDFCQTVGPTPLSNVNPNEIVNPSTSSRASFGGNGCAPQAGVAFGINDDGVQFLFCEFKEAGKEYPQSCEQRKLHDIEEKNKKADDKRREQSQSKTAVIAASGPSSDQSLKTEKQKSQRFQKSGEGQRSTDWTRGSRTTSTPNKNANGNTSSRNRSYTGVATPVYRSYTKIGTSTASAIRNSTSSPAAERSSKGRSDSTVSVKTLVPPTIGNQKTAFFTTSPINRKFTSTAQNPPSPKTESQRPVRTSSTVAPRVFSGKTTKNGDSAIGARRDFSHRSNSTRSGKDNEDEFCICLCNQKCSTKNSDVSKRSNRRAGFNFKNGNNENFEEENLRVPRAKRDKTGRGGSAAKRETNRKTNSTEINGNTLPWKETSNDGKPSYVIVNEQKLKVCPQSKCNCGCVCN